MQCVNLHVFSSPSGFIMKLPWSTFQTEYLQVGHLASTQVHRNAALYHSLILAVTVIVKLTAV
jgi:hypothetical protein